MRLLKFTFALWFDPSWRANLKRSWTKRGYWWTREPGKLFFGPYRVEVKVFPPLKGESELKVFNG